MPMSGRRLRKDPLQFKDEPQGWFIDVEAQMNVPPKHEGKYQIDIDIYPVEINKGFALSLFPSLVKIYLLIEMVGK